MAQGDDLVDEALRGRLIAAVLSHSVGTRALCVTPRRTETEKAVTAGNSIALERPCATSKSAPMGRLMPCTSATLEFEKAIPASVAADIIAARASRSSPSRKTRRRFALIVRIAESAKASETGFALRLTYASTACVRASTPVSAVSRAGIDIVSLKSERVTLRVAV